MAMLEMDPAVKPRDDSGTLDLWYHERRHNEVAFGLRVTNILHSEQSAFQKVDIFESAGFGRVLTLDGLMMCTDKDEFSYHEHIVHIPMLSHANPQKILIIGGGDCGTLTEVLKHSCVESVVMCEIDGAVVNACLKYFPKFAAAHKNPKAKICIEDGVAFVKNSPSETYDIVIVDSAEPVGFGEELFSGNFYREVKRILKPKGIVVAQSESPWEEKLDLSKIYGNLKTAFPHVYAMVGSIPSYPYGYWSWAFASEDVHPVNNLQVDRAREIQKTTHYYNVEIHRAAFALPNFLKRKLMNLVDNGAEVA